MGKQILILKGSPRSEGNSDMLADALIEGAQKNRHIVKEFQLSKMNLSGCQACNGCWDSKGNCIIRDDLKQLEPYLECADVLVIATPLYWAMFPAQVKAFMDRMYEYDPLNGGKHLQISESILLACGETENSEDFRLIKEVFCAFSEFNGMKVREIICVPGVNAKGDIKGNAFLDCAKQLGENI